MIFMPERFAVKLAIITGLLVMIIMTGCTAAGGLAAGKNATPPDPETGIRTWVAAVNAHDVTALYYLAPDELQKQVTLDQFTSANTNNTFLTGDRFITGYEILNKTSNASTANIKAVILLRQTSADNSSETITIPVYLNYQEWFEDGEWKVWTVPWS